MSSQRQQFPATLFEQWQGAYCGGFNGSVTLSAAELYTPRTADIYAQKYDKDGTAQWGSGADIKVNSDSGNRETTGNNASNYDHLNPKVKLDGSGNAIVAWQESRNSVYGDDIYAQKLQSSDGAKLWPAASTSTDRFTNTTGGMVVAHQNYIGTLLSNGKVLFAGGYNYITSAELYDPSANTFFPPLPAV